MKKILFTALTIVAVYNTYAQNTFPSSGNVGIGTGSPTRLLEVVSGAGIGPLKIVGPNGSLLIDNVGSGESYYHANSFHLFQGINGVPIMTMLGSGNVGVGTANPDAKLAVKGTIHTQEIKVDMIGWPDYVFKPTYKLLSLTQVKAYINDNGHLPEMPSETEVKEKGVKVGEMLKLQTKKIEELTLYLIEKDKQVAEQNKLLKQQETRLAALEAKLKRMASAKR